MSRRSEVAPKSNKTDFNLSLLEHALKDPASQNLILQLLSTNKKNLFELFNTGAPALNSPVKRIKKVDHCESPTALLRRRELEKRNRAESFSSKISEQSIQSLTPGGSRRVAFDVILKGVVAYAEINSGGYDRSGGVKALLRSMGATVCEKFTRDVTHVIFKDGLYTTFQRAKLLKVHLVSVLWLEASRQNGIKAQEKNFPALGSKNYDLDVSMICSQMQKEYEEVLKDEIKKNLNSGTPIPTAKTMMEDRRRTIGYSSNSFETSSQFGHRFINRSIKTGLSERGRSPSFQPSLTLGCASPAISTDEDLSIMSKKISSDILNSSSSDSFRPKSLQFGKNSESDTASECGMIDGDFSQKEIVLDDSLGGMGPLQSDEVFTSNMEITCSENNSSESNGTSTSRIDMDLTTPSGGVLQTITGSLLNSISYLTSKGKCSTMVKTVLNGKENHHVSTSGDTSTREKQKDIDTTASTISKKKNVSQGLTDSPSALLEKENFNNDDDFYSLKTPKFKASKKNLSNTMDLMQDEIGPSKQNECSTKNSNVNCPQELSAENTMKFTPSSNSSLRMCRGSLENSGKPNVSSSILHSENTKKIIHSDLLTENVNRNVHNEKVILPLSSTPFVTERKKRRTGTQIKNGLNDSIFSESPSRNTRSSKNRNSIINKRKNGSCDDDSICGLEIGNNNILQKSVTTPLPITPVETGGNNKITTRRNVKHEIITGSGDLNSSDSPIRNTKIIKECSILNKEKQNSEKELRISYEEENETETTSRKSVLRTPRPERKYASITPTKSDVFISPFVNTRPRRKSAARALEKMIEYDNEISENTTGSSRQISLIKRGQPTRSPKKIEKPGLGITLEVDTQLTEEGPDAKELSKIMEDDENLSQDNSLNEPLKSVVLLQDVQVSPLHNKQTEAVDKPPQKKSMVSLDSSSKKGTELSSLKRKKDDFGSQSEKKLRTTRSSTVLLSSNAENEVQPSNERKTERNSKRKTMGVSSRSVSKKDAVTNIQERKIEANDINELKGPNQVSKKKSEFSIQDTRMSKRIRRKLYDPNYCYSEQQIQEKLGVNDQEEGETIRQKCFKVNVESENCSNNGNVLMSHKALNFLEETQTNTRTLFKEPETILNQLGIEKEEKKEESVMEDSADEQVDLAEEFVHKKKVKKSLDDIQTSQKTPRTQKTQRNLPQKALTTGNRKRRSTMDFVPKTSNKPKMATTLDFDKKPPTIVCTKLHKADVQIFSKIVAKLGKFEIEDEVSSRTTHLVVGETKRTVNMLKAISRGCWILKHEWLISSLEEGRWIPEEKYELTEFSSAVQQCRLRRQAFGPSYHMNIFLNCGMIFVAKSTVPRCSDLRELITLCGGRVTKFPDNAKISVGTYLEDIDSVNEYWILDSISSGRLEPIENYFIVPASTHPKSPYV